MELFFDIIGAHAVGGGLLSLTRLCILQAALEHKIDPMGSPLHPDHSHDSATGSVKRFKDIVFQSFSDRYHNSAAKGGEDSD